MPARSRSSERLRSVTDLACVVLFSAALALPLLGFVFDWHPVVPPEKPLHRADAPLPELYPLDGLATRIDRYFQVHLGFRQRLVRWNSAVTLLWLHTSPETRIRDRDDLYLNPGRSMFGDVILGREGWLFYFAPFSEDSLRGLDPMGPEVVADWRRYFENRHRLLATRGVRYLLVIVPEKYSALPELLPSHMQQRTSPSRSDQLVAELEANSGVNLLDLRGFMRELESEHPIYHSTGTHWNELGAFRAYQALIERLQRWFPLLEPRRIEDFAVEHRVGPARLLADLLSLSGMVADEYVDLVPREPRIARTIGLKDRWRERGLHRRTGRRALPRAVFLHDSFVASYMEPFLSEHFEAASYFWQAATPLSRVLRANPDLVVEVRVERYFDRWIAVPNGLPVDRLGLAAGD